MATAARPLVVRLAVRGRVARAALAGLAGAAAFAAFANAAPGVPVGVPAAAGCANLTLDIGAPLGRIPVRFVLIGNVTCIKAHSLARAYFRKLAARQCGELNNFCNLRFPGGWACSVFPAAQSRGAIGGCARQPGSARFRFYNARRASAARAGTRTLARVR
jgi:hypothetical protein